MDNKVTKQRIGEHLEYDWFWYVVILIASVFVCYFVFSQINTTRDYEDVQLFVTCYEEKEHDFSQHVKDAMRSRKYDDALAEKYGQAVLRNVDVEAQDPLGKSYATLVQTHGFVSSDIIILGEKYLQGMGNGFLELTDVLLLDYLLPRDVAENEAAYDIDDLEYYEVDGRRYGIKVSSFTNLPFETDWRAIESYKEKYAETEADKQPDDVFYLVINPKSVNIGKFGRKSKNENAQALYVVNRFIKYYHHSAI